MKENSKMKWQSSLDCTPPLALSSRAVRTPGIQTPRITYWHLQDSSKAGDVCPGELLMGLAPHGGWPVSAVFQVCGKRILCLEHVCSLWEVCTGAPMSFEEQGWPLRVWMPRACDPHRCPVLQPHCNRNILVDVFCHQACLLKSPKLCLMWLHFDSWWKDLDEWGPARPRKNEGVAAGNLGRLSF